MDHIAQQLKAEIESLRDYIQRTEDCLQVTGWVEELVDSFEPLEEKFSEPELHKVLHALCTAKFHFCVNGHLSQRIDGILERHQDLVAHLRAGKEDHSSSWPAKDPETYADISQEEDEERTLFIGEEDPSSSPLPTIAEAPQPPAQEASLFQAGNFDELPNEEEPDISSLWAVGDDTDSQAPARNGSLFQAPDLDLSWDDEDDTQTPVFHAPDLDALPCDDAEEEGAQALFSSDGEDSAEYTQPHPTSPDAVMPDENLEELFPPSFSASQQNQPAEKAPPQPDEKEDELFESLIPPPAVWCSRAAGNKDQTGRPLRGFTGRPVSGWIVDRNQIGDPFSIPHPFGPAQDSPPCRRQNEDPAGSAVHPSGDPRDPGSRPFQ